jgi:hypothetical protein
MIWIFERQGRVAKLETIYLPPQSYEIRFVDGAGVEHVETFSDPAAANSRQWSLLAALKGEGWEKSGEWKL